jgi:hypothetical protein
VPLDDRAIDRQPFARRRDAVDDLRLTAHDLKRRIEQCHLYMLAKPAAMPPNQRGDNAVRGDKRSIARGQRHCAVDRVGRRLRQARVIQPGGSRYNALPAGKTGARIVGGEARQRAKDQVPMAFGHLQRAKTKPVHDPRPEILNHHIGRGDQVARDRQIIRAFEVQHDAALATLQYGIGGMAPAGPARGVDANDLRPKSMTGMPSSAPGHLTMPRSRA